MPCEIVYITVYDLNNIIPENNLDLYKKSLKKYPNNAELRQLYWEKRNWDRYKKSLLNNIQCQKYNKYNFEKQLRLPFLRISFMKAPLNKIDIKSSDSNLYFTVLDNDESLARNVETKRKVTTNMPKLAKNRSTMSQSQSTNSLLDRIRYPQSTSDKLLAKGQRRPWFQNKASLPVITEHL